MDRLIVAFEGEKSRARIADMLESCGIPVRYRCRSGAEAIRAVKKMGGGIVVCGYKLADMTASDLAFNLTDMAMLLVVAKPTLLELCDSDEVFKLPAPVSGTELTASVKMLSQIEERRQRVTVPKRTEDENEMVMLAKQLLMERNRMTEPQAHKFIQKKSMETGSKMADTARLIISAYDFR